MSKDYNNSHVKTSLPSWERGLKHVKHFNLCVWVTSLPSWERGLKQIIDGCYFYSQIVAPFVGAWIETSGSAGLMVSTVVAPFVGAWIETVT